MKRLSHIIVLALAVLMLSAGSSFASSFPTKNMKIIVPFAPGGAVDFTCRLIAKVAPKYLNGKKVIVRNMPGGGAVIGQTFVANARPDGYTLLGYTSSVVNNPITKKTTYTYKSFQPVVMYCLDPTVLVVPANSKYKTLKQFLDAAKEKSISVATPGYSTSHHIAALLIQGKSGAKFDYIHNQSAAMQLQELMGGHVDASVMSSGEAKPHMDDGSIRVLGITADRPNPAFPNVPTFVSEGVDLTFGTFRGLAVPAGTPKEVMDTLAEAFKKIVKDPEFVKGMEHAGYPMTYRGPKEFSDFVANDAVLMNQILPTLKKK
ncbi:tripartite tricarboxylate transporter substrate binding protein [Maridesulfovibrio bastinii]|jgi:tripartite-type tricarboxylate transporter receptor subunit TctC|uniref:tripartite tricarboxylate transporter substrate binding protein n=1 Tax=Maridesulfovibrio bastinii TaxID=47157 RepID=UPI00042A070C|nr:tripartite tricarboxylate transporter substrate binding protein [Maridesulfovibrio bastinii]